MGLVALSWVNLTSGPTERPAQSFLGQLHKNLFSEPFQMYK